MKRTFTLIIESTESPDGAPYDTTDAQEYVVTVQSGEDWRSVRHAKVGRATESALLDLLFEVPGAGQ